MTNLESRNYLVATGCAQARGTFLIIRKVDDYSTLRFVCSEGLQDYKRLVRAYRTKRAVFDAMCAQYEFTA